MSQKVIDFVAEREARMTRREVWPRTYLGSLKQLRSLLRVHGYQSGDDALTFLLQPALVAIVAHIHSLAPSRDRAERDMNRIVANQDRRWVRDFPTKCTG